MRHRSATAALAMAMALLLPVTAKAGCKLGECLLGVTGDSIMGVMGMHDMKGGRWVVQASPGYITGKVGSAINPTDTFDLKGYSGAFAVKREFTAHWGFGLVGGFAMQSGKSTLTGPSGLAPAAAFAEMPVGGTNGSDGYSGGEISNMYGNSVAALLTWDPFSDPDGFRMPISVGPAMIWEGFEFRHAFTNPNAGNAAQVDTAKVHRSDLGALANVSFDLPPLKDFRLMPGFTVGVAPGTNYAQYDYTVQRNGATFGTFRHETAMQPMFVSIYTALAYRPWDIGLNYIISSTANKVKNYSLTLTKKWGGD